MRLRGSGQRGVVHELVVLAGEGVRARRLPQSLEDLQLLLELLEPLPERREVDAERRVLRVVPAGAETELNNSMNGDNTGTMFDDAPITL